jgi:hypothetical protein
MRGNQRQHDGRLLVAVEVGPVHGDVDAGAGTDHIRHPAAQSGRNIDPLVGQEAIHLFDGVLG